MKVKIKSKPEEWLEVHKAYNKDETRVYELSDGSVVTRDEVLEFRYDEELGDIKLKLDN